MFEATSAKAAPWKTSSLGIMYGLSPTCAAAIESPRCQLDQVEDHRGAVALVQHDPPAEGETCTEQHRHDGEMEPVEDHVDRVGSQRHRGRQYENAGDGCSESASQRRSRARSPATRAPSSAIKAEKPMAYGTIVAPELP